MSISKRWKTALAAVMAAVVGGASQAVEAGADSLAQADNQFGLELFQSVADSNTQSNVFLSPASAAMALAMLYNGADGTTQAEMEQVLRLQGWSLERINELNVALRETLTSADTAVQFSIANSMWLKPGFAFREDFLQRTKRAFDAELGWLEAAKPINEWVKKKTRGKIDKILESVAPDDIMVLLNAIYFKGTWTLKFDSAATQDRDFTLLSGDKTKLPMMDRSDEYGYFATGAFQAIRLPYGSGRYAMYVFLPTRGDFTTFRRSITPDNWVKWRGQFEARKGRIVLPRFKLEQEFELGGVLKAMGMESAFDAHRADLTRMWDRQGEENLYVSAVKQKTYVEVNEEGTEAAAATAVIIKGLEAMTPVQPPFEMIVDRPFVTAIVDEVSGLILFVGAVVDPG